LENINNDVLILCHRESRAEKRLTILTAITTTTAELLQRIEL
jgi:hypothetical protein